MDQVSLPSPPASSDSPAPAQKLTMLPTSIKPCRTMFPYVLELFHSAISPSSSQVMRNAPGAESDLWHRNIAERSICTPERRVEAECSNAVGLIGLADIPFASPALAALVAILSAAACARSAGSSSCGGEDSREGPLLLEKAHLVMLPAQLPITVAAPAQLDILSTSLL